MSFYNSRYNFCFQAKEGVILYNSKSGATTTLNGVHAQELSELLVGDKRCFDESDFDIITLQQFTRNGFLVESGSNEMDAIKETYWKARGMTPMVLTITTTMDCNLGCYYCYESRTKQALTSSDIESIISYLEESFKRSGKKSLHVDWYGGEPLLNVEFLEMASLRLQEFCKESKISFHASIISNGTVWPSNLSQFIQEHKIRQVQISFDGMKENHNKRRRYLKISNDNQSNNSFDKIVSLVDELLNLVHVDIRFNIDFRNKGDIMTFLDFIIRRGWFSKAFPAVFQPARISSYSEKSSFLEESQLPLEEFNQIREKIRLRLENIGIIEESEVPDSFPFPKTFVCAALASDSLVVGADKLIYRCGLQVGEKNRAVASLQDEKKEFGDTEWWDTFDPTELPSCSKCSFLPICLGGCPKKHLESDRRALDEQSEYWRTNLAKKVLNPLGLHPSFDSVLTKQEQFREGYE